MKYVVIIEKATTNYSAYVPDLPGCVSTGKTIEETTRNIGEAIEMHIESLREHNEPIPEASTTTGFVEVDVPAARASA